MKLQLSVVEALLRLAQSYRWVRETQGSNRGEVVNRFLSRVGLEPGNPWCAAFVSVVGQDMLLKEWPLPMVGGCATLGEAAAAKKMLFDQPAPGAIFLIYCPSKKRFAHTGFVVGPDTDGHWITIEGNTAEDGGRDGTGVFKRRRKFGPEDRFVYWWAPQ